MKLTHLVGILGLSLSASAFAANSDQAAIDALQKQVVQVQSEMHQALSAQQATTQKAISDLQTQVQAQLAHMQTEIQQMQTQLTGEIKQVQSEAVKGSAAPVETATPGPAVPAAPAAPAKP